MQLHFQVLGGVKFYLATFQKKNNKTKKKNTNHESLCHPLKNLKLLNKREQQWNNIRKTALIFPKILQQMLGAFVHLLRITKA